MASCAPGRWRGHTPAPVTGSRSPPTSAGRMFSTRPSPSSRSPTPTRTSVTIKPSSTPPPPDGSPPSTADDHGPGRAPGGAPVAPARAGAAVSAPARVWHERADEPQDRREEPDQAENPVALAERDNGQGK